jgi:hypothetical protein
MSSPLEGPSAMGEEGLPAVVNKAKATCQTIQQNQLETAGEFAVKFGFVHTPSTITHFKSVMILLPKLWLPSTC